MTPRHHLYSRLALTALALFGSLWLSTASAEMTVIILRHGEKPDQGLGQLTCQGLNRSLALAQVLLSRYGMPDAIYAPSPAILKEDKGTPYPYVRPLATVEPLAIRAQRPITIVGGMTETLPLVEMVTSHHDGTYVIAWEHHWAETLAKQLLVAFGGKPTDVPKWKDDDFDSLYVISSTSQNNDKPLVTFRHEYEGLNGMSDQCPNLLPPQRVGK